MKEQQSKWMVRQKGPVFSLSVANGGTVTFAFVYRNVNNQRRRKDFQPSGIHNICGTPLISI